MPRDIEPACRELPGVSRPRHRRRPADRRAQRLRPRGRGAAGGADHRRRARSLRALARLARGGADDRRPARARRRDRAAGDGGEREPLGEPRRGRPRADASDGEGGRRPAPARADRADAPLGRRRGGLQLRQRPARAVRPRRRNHARGRGRRQRHGAAPQRQELPEARWRCGSRLAAARWRWPRPAWSPRCWAAPSWSRSPPTGEVGDKSRFVRGVEGALLDGEAEIGVHSAKDLPGEMPEGLRSPRCRRARIRPTPGSAPAPRSRTCPRGPGSGPRACAGAPSCWPRARTYGSRSCTATSTPVCASSPRATSTAIVLAAAGLRRLGREAEIGFRLPTETDDAGARAGHAGGPDPRRRRARRWRRSTTITDLDGAARADCRAGHGGAARGRAAQRRSASTPGSRASARRSAPSSASRTAASGSATGSRAKPIEPTELGLELARRLLDAGAAELLGARGGERADERPRRESSTWSGPGPATRG